MLPLTLYLTLHGLGHPGLGVDAGAARYWLPTESFERLLAVVPEIEAREGIRIALTFDDACRSDLEVAAPRLARAGRSALFLVPTGLMGAPGHLAPAEVRRLSELGMAIGSHGHAHIDWTGAGDAVLADEASGSRRRLEDLLGRPVVDLSFPFGMFDRRCIHFARAAGFRRLFTSSGGFATASEGLVARVSLRREFDAVRDLPRFSARSERWRAALVDRLRRLKYWTPRDPAAGTDHDISPGVRPRSS
jgi:peptidoglycan/xylan/chitin deacetylase (PgdA/CDA1 family)